MLMLKSLKPSTPSELSYFRGNIKCNFEEAISLYGHVYGLSKGGFIARAGSVSDAADCHRTCADTKYRRWSN